jgi:hypothetical protein
MSLIDRIKSALGFKPALRNKAGGMAWVRGIPAGCGAEQLNNRAVKTVLVQETGLWEIDPPQDFKVTRACLFGLGQVLVFEGQVVTVSAIHDDLLEPWRDMDWNAKDESHRYLPPVAPAPARITSPTVTQRFPKEAPHA